ncbi:ML domain-containing protein [Streptomyces sp. 1114.5]|uniref:ML domain-containing protein n=1 Tax=unclassified Streptomyces TaxID=2593676 RepID=UPI000BD92960|nr:MULTISPECIES: ML domain-containing protein [unclassified Streptomyces]RKT18996.1 ML domain-containing protein [Streptomyces sp. 1114.5]SOB85196.1 ML domain-containing protein [Streptomyces sp. 1331.2]
MAGWDYSDVGLPTDPLQITSITVTPDPPLPGKTNVFTINATAQEEIQDGAYLDVVIKLGLIKLMAKKFDLLAELRGEGSLQLACSTSDGKSPIPKGPTTLTLTLDLSRETPRAKFSINVRGYTVDDDDLLGLDVKVDFLTA